jgi:peptide chain release factor 3
MLDGAQGGSDRKEVLHGQTTPVFFGSAANNFGVELLLNGYIEYSSSPVARHSRSGLVPLDSSNFSGFVFKVQTNMNPMHRDRMVFIRVCSGKFLRGIKVYHTRSGKEIRLSSSHNVFGRDREVVDEAYPGDILGFVTNTSFRIGDTISSNLEIVFDEIPRFAPECFAYLHNVTASSYKSFRKGLDHLLAEDIVQIFRVDGHSQNLPLLGAVGPLQFEVFQYRLKEEYGAESRLEMMPWAALRWLDSPVDESELKKSLPYGATIGFDELSRRVLLFQNTWSMQNYADKNSSIVLLDSQKE